jgi:anthranilate phosphoribosyltransferase
VHYFLPSLLGAVRLTQPFVSGAGVKRALLAAVLGAPIVLAQSPAFPEHEGKAAFLYHFGTYVEWPESAQAQESITIAVLGAPMVVAQLQEFLPGRTILDRPVVVRTLSSINEVADAHLLFIGAESNARLRQLIDRVGRRPVLIVTDSDDGLEQGAMVNFKVVDERLRFEISVSAAEKAGLTLSSRLLATAVRVES